MEVKNIKINVDLTMSDQHELNILYDYLEHNPGTLERAVNAMFDMGLYQWEKMRAELGHTIQ